VRGSNGYHSPIGLSQGQTTQITVPRDAVVYLQAIAKGAAGSPEIKIIDPVPSIEDITPSVLEVLKEFTIAGRNFGDSPSIVWMRAGSQGTPISVPIVSWSDTEIVAVADGPAGDVQVTARNRSPGEVSRPFLIQSSQLWLLQRMTEHWALSRGTFTYNDSDVGGPTTCPQFPLHLPDRSGYDSTLHWSDTAFSVTFSGSVSADESYTDTVSGEVDPLGNQLVAFHERWTSNLHADQGGTCVYDTTQDYELGLSGLWAVRSGSTPETVSFDFHAVGAAAADAAGTMVEVRTERQTGPGLGCSPVRDISFVAPVWSDSSQIGLYLDP
jgi:hypothetical protein